MLTRLACVAAVAALLAGCGSDPSPSPPPAAPRPHVTTAHNRAMALAESERLLTVLAPPDGGKVVGSAPVADLRDPLEGVGPSDGTLSRHAWWTVPMTPEGFARWVRSRHPARLKVGDGGSSSALDGTTVDILELDGTGTAAYSAPVMTVAYLPYAGGVAVRLDTFLAARYARTTYLPDDVTRVVVQRTVRGYRPGSRVHTRRTVVTEPARIARLVRAANDLPGTVTVANIFHCPLMTTVKSYEVTFTSPGGTYRLSGGGQTCAPLLTLRRDGRAVLPALDPGRSWFPMLDGVLAGR